MTTDLHQRVLATFLGAFDAPPLAIVQAPGRVNLIGEHTDYNDGFVLPCAIGFQTLVAIRPRDDAVLRVVASDYGNSADEFRVDQPVGHRARPAWADYVRGVVSVLQARGLPLRGANLAIAGDVPRGAGLSSSASLEVAVALALQTLGLSSTTAATADASPWAGLTPVDLALIAQRAENDFVGCQCGIMDQLISALGQPAQALLIDCRSLETQPVAIPEDVAVMIVHSNVKRGLVDSAYNLRRAQCRAAAESIGVASLREATPEALEAARDRMDPVSHRRARHVVGENARTLAAAEALRAGDLHQMGRLMAASHAAMRDDFEITVPAIDRLVEILQLAIGDEGGARMTGGGFGGCVVALMPTSAVDRVTAAVERDYHAPDGSPGTVYVTQPAAGAGLLGGRPARG